VRVAINMSPLFLMEIEGGSGSSNTLRTSEIILSGSPVRTSVNMMTNAFRSVSMHELSGACSETTGGLGRENL
jgi:hypothetical protein